MARSQPAFFSYSRSDSEFALRLAADLKAGGAYVWLDQLDIPPGQRWDRGVEDALTNCPCLLVILSPAAINSTNVMDEVSFALEEKKHVIPILHRDCAIPFRLRRVQYLDFRHDYACGLKELLNVLAPASADETSPVVSDVVIQAVSAVAEAKESERAAEEGHRKGEQQEEPEQGRREAVGQGQLEEERGVSAEWPALEEEHKRPWMKPATIVFGTVIVALVVYWVLNHWILNP
jgi:hypothetical protein